MCKRGEGLTYAKSANANVVGKATFSTVPSKLWNMVSKSRGLLYSHIRSLFFCSPSKKLSVALTQCLDSAILSLGKVRTGCRIVCEEGELKRGSSLFSKFAHWQAESLMMIE